MSYIVSHDRYNPKDGFENKSIYEASMEVFEETIGEKVDSLVKELFMMQLRIMEECNMTLTESDISQFINSLHCEIGFHHLRDMKPKHIKREFPFFPGLKYDV